MTEPEQDIFRAAVVVAGAGVDTVLKEALRGCLSLRITSTGGARDMYQDWVTRYIQSGSGLNPRRIAELLTANTGDALEAAYLSALTSSSLQSRTQVTSTLSALGFDSKTDKNFYVSAASLDSLFRVRNQIAHEMDMTPSAVRGQGERTRNDRPIKTYVDICHTGLNYCQRVLNRLEPEMSSTAERR